MVGAPPLDPSSLEFVGQEQSMLDYRGWFFIPNTSARGQLFINSVTLYSDDNFATVLDSIIIISSLQVV